MSIGRKATRALGVAAALAAVGASARLFLPAPVAAQAASGWRCQDDAFADLWFHGLAMVGFYGFGPLPLYDPGYGRAVRQARGTADLASTPLEHDRQSLLERFRGDDAFELFHFLPLYFHGAGRMAAVAALESVAATARGAPADVPAEARFGTSVVAQLLGDSGERRVLGTFVGDLKEEWRDEVEPRRARDAAARDHRLVVLRAAWNKEWAPALAPFLEAEGFTTGTVVVVPALGAEGRFLERDPGGAAGPLLILGAPADDGTGAATLSSLVRELCYPTVRRVFASFEARFDDRIGASRASDLTATRCGELLLEGRAPAQVPAYRARFGLPAGGMGRAFLSDFGHVPGAAAWEGDLERALLRELNLESNAARLPPRPSGDDR